MARKMNVRTRIWIKIFLILSILSVYRWIKPYHRMINNTDHSISLQNQSVSNGNYNPLSWLGMVSDSSAATRSAPWVEEMMGSNSSGFLHIGNNFLLSAFASNTSTEELWDLIVVNSWQDQTEKNVTYICCFRHSDASVCRGRRADVLKNAYDRMGYKMPLFTVQYRCYTNDKSGQHIVGLTVVKENSSCPDDVKKYLQLRYLHRPEKKTLAVSAKVVYGSKDPVELIQWFEVQKYYGVDKVLIYPYFTINDGAIKVLLHYEETGLLEVVPYYHVPMKDKCKREFNKFGSICKYQDLHAMVRDSHERLKEYEYAILMDTDEYIIPTKAKSYIELMDTLLQWKPRQAGFKFYDHLYFTTWGVIDPTSDIQIGRYLNRTVTMLDRPKNIFVPERVKQGTLNIHYIRPKPGYDYSGLIVPEELAVLKHYRPCRENWSDQYCMVNLTRIRDNGMTALAATISQRVGVVRRKLGL